MAGSKDRRSMHSSMDTQPSQFKLVAVHVGAGLHSRVKEPAYKTAMRHACTAAAACLDAGGTPLRAAAAGVAILEDDPCTNAGLGSNLTWSGTVQCDASIMGGDGSFGAVGAAGGIQNPVRAALALAEDSQQPLSCGRVRPMLLVSDGAKQYAESQGLHTASAEAMQQYHMTQPALVAWAKCRQMVEGTTGMADSLVPGEASQASAIQGPQGQGPVGEAAGAMPASNGFDAGQATSATAPPSLGLADAWHERPRQRKRSRPTGMSVQPTLVNIDRGSTQPDPAQSLAVPQQQALPGFMTYVGVDAARAKGGSAADSGGLPLDPLHMQPGSGLGEERLHDTVGCIVVDAAGRVAAGVSSGGILLKADGRVGEAALYACGCWAANAEPASPPTTAHSPASARDVACTDQLGQQAGDHVSAGDARSDSRMAGGAGYVSTNTSVAVAVSVSGVGEAVMRSLLAREAALQLQARPQDPADQVLSDVLARHMSSARRGRASREPVDCGILAVRAAREDSKVQCELTAAHTCPSMGIGFRCTSAPAAQLGQGPASPCCMPVATDPDCSASRQGLVLQSKSAVMLRRQVTATGAQGAAAVHVWGKIVAWPALHGNN